MTNAPSPAAAELPRLPEETEQALRTLAEAFRRHAPQAEIPRLPGETAQALRTMAECFRRHAPHPGSEPSPRKEAT